MYQRSRILFAVCVVLYVVGSYLTSLAISGRGGFESELEDYVDGACILAFGLVAVLLARRGNPYWIVPMAACAIYQFGVAVGGYAAYANFSEGAPHAGGDVAAAIGNSMFVPAVGTLLTLLVLRFPDGRLPGARWRWIERLAIFGILVSALAAMLAPGPLDEDTRYGSNPIGIPGGEAITDAGILVGGLLLVVGVLAAFASLAVRYRRGDAVERRQVRILAAGFGALVVLFALDSTLQPIIPGEGVVQAIVALLAPPIAIWIAAVRTVPDSHATTLAPQPDPA